MCSGVPALESPLGLLVMYSWCLGTASSQPSCKEKWWFLPHTSYISALAPNSPHIHRTLQNASPLATAKPRALLKLTSTLANCS